MNFHFLEPKGKLYIEVDQCELIRENKILMGVMHGAQS